jgi:methionyl-tRNA formyltransferase
MRIALAGKKDRATACLRAIESTSHEVVAVIVPKNDSAGFLFESVTDYATAHDTQVLTPRNINSKEFQETLKGFDLDLVVLASYNQIIRKQTFEIPKRGFINLHGGKLPEYRGSSVLNWMIINREKEAGVSIIQVDEGIDTGAVLAQERWEIKPKDTIIDLVNESHRRFSSMLVDVLNCIEDGSIEPQEQDPLDGAYYHSRIPEDGKIQWEKMTDIDVHHLVRSLVKPYPGAFCFKNGKRILVWETELMQEEVRGIPGRVARTTRTGGAIVICANRGILLKRLQMVGSEEADVKQIVSYGDQLI